ncbi:hypothetical protein UlMin_004191 [Ulmus minor]
MGFSNTLFGSLKILKEAYKIFLRKGKIIPFITLLFLFVSSILFLSNFLFIKPLLIDFTTKLYSLLITIPTPGGIDSTNLVIYMIDIDDLRIFAGREWIFIVFNSFISIFFVIATIISSSAEYCEKKLGFKDLQVRIIKTWKRTFVTYFYTTLLRLGYAFFVLSFLLPLVMIFNSKIIITFFSILIFILAILFGLYLAIVWTLALIVSTLEEKSGIEALGKAGRLVKGLKVKGFFLKLLFETLYDVTLILFMRISKNQSISITVVLSLVSLISVCLVKIFSFVAFTVFYYESKKTHGEEVELQDTNLKYTKVPTMPLIAAEIP